MTISLFKPLPYRSFIQSLGLTFMLTCLSACNSSFFLGTDNTKVAELTNINQISGAQLVWSQQIGGSLNASFFNVRPAMNTQLMIGATPNGYITALDRATGKLNWQTRLDNVRTGVVINQQFAFATTQTAQLVALNLSTGQIAWQQTLNGNALTPPVARDDIVVIRTISGAITAFDAVSGTVRWSYTVAKPDIVLSGSTAPVLLPQGVLVPTDLAQVGFLDTKTGAVIWGKNFPKARGDNTAQTLLDIKAAPIIKNNIAYIAMVNNGIHAISLNNGQTLWSQPDGSFNGLAANDQALFLSDTNSRLHALDIRNGRSLWQSETLLGRRITQPVVMPRGIVVGDFEGYVHLLEPRTGNLIGSQKISTVGFLPNLIHDMGSVYLQDTNGVMHKVSL